MGAGEIIARPRSAVARRLAETGTGLTPSAGPQSVSVVLTNACNLRCVTCWSYSPLRAERPKTEWMRRHLERDELARVFAELAEIGAERVIFTGGGDPLAHPDFAGIAGDAKAAGLKVTLISNLTLARDPSALAALRLDTILANFSSADPQSYVAFHPGRAAADFDRLLNTLRQLADHGSELKLVFVVCAVNAHVVPALLEIAADLRASIQLKLMSATDDTRTLILTPDMVATLFARRDSLTARAAALGVRANLDVFYAELSGDSPDVFPIETVGCHAGRWYARIDADGFVRYCCNPNPSLTLGSIRESSFADLWRSATWQDRRDRLEAGHFVPGCERCGKFDLNTRIAARFPPRSTVNGTAVPRSLPVVG